MTPAHETLQDAVDRVRDRDPRFPREAYVFVVTAIVQALRQMPAERAADPERRHLHGREVVASVVALAQAEFGPLGATVFGEWGMTSPRQVGEIVFDLIECGQLSARSDDRIEDFLGDGALLIAPRGPGRDATPRVRGA